MGVIPEASDDSSGVPGVTAPSAAADSPTAREIMSRSLESVRIALEPRRPWAEMTDLSAFSKPESLGDAADRIRKNWWHFRLNYGIVIAAVFALRLVVHPFYLLLLVSILAGWTYLYFVRTNAVVVFGRTLSETELLLFATLLSVVLLLMAGIVSLLITSLLIGIGFTLIHGAFRAVPDDLFLHDQDAPSGFFPFFGSAGAPVNPPVSSHV
jgi:hypothetical protein